MSSYKKPVATSTPYGSSRNSSVLKEKQQNINAQPHHKQREKKRLSWTGAFTDSKPAKENVIKRPAVPRSSDKEQKEAMKRQQAIDAMKICEQRRLRICQEAVTEELDRMTLKPPLESKDDVTEKKRIEAKRLKEKRIKAYLAEQEARKKKEADTEVRKNCSVKPASRGMFPKYRPKMRCTYKPLIFKQTLPKLPEDCEVIVPVKNNVMKIYDEPRRYRPVIRYTKDEIRSLNPYGYYFL